MGRKTLGCLTAPHNWIMLLFELSKKPFLKERFLAGPSTGSSFTSKDTADVISGSNAVTPKTDLEEPMHN